MEEKAYGVSEKVDLYALFSLAKDAAALGAAIHRERLTSNHTLNTKSSRTDWVTEVDREAERKIVETLLESRPHDAILAEEGSSRDGSSGVRWVIDPLDGTVNYVYGYPAFAVSICAEIDGKYRVGVVHDSYHSRVYGGIIDRVSSCDGVPLRVSSAEQIADSLIATGFGYDPSVRTMQAQYLAHLLPRVRDIRRSGSAAIDLCLLAAGQIDGYYEVGLKAWDYAAGGVIATAAGARVLTFFPKTGLAPLVVAANPVLAPKLLNLLGEIGAINPNEAQVDLWK